MKKTMSKTDVINHAKSVVGGLYKFGNGWKFNVYDEKYKAWRETNPTNYHQAQTNRGVALIEEANTFSGLSQDGAFNLSSDYAMHGGKWTDYVK